MPKSIAIIILCVLLCNCRGRDGATGQTIAGPQGPKGDQGDIGYMGPAGPQGVPGIQGPIGNTGPSGSNGSNGSNGNNGATGPQGVPGPAGINGTVITIIQFCPGVTPIYPTIFPEVGLCINNQIYAVYSANNGFMVLVVPGAYHSNAIGSACSFTVLPNCVIQ